MKLNNLDYTVVEGKLVIALPVGATNARIDYAEIFYSVDDPVLTAIATGDYATLLAYVKDVTPEEMHRAIILASLTYDGNDIVDPRAFGSDSVADLDHVDQLLKLRWSNFKVNKQRMKV